MLYHVTYLFNLPSIKENGLRPGSGEVFTGSWSEYSRGKLFLTVGEGVNYWVERLEQWAHHHSDHHEEGWAPIVLEVATETEDIHPDVEGTRDARAPAVYTHETIDPLDMSVWFNGAWIDVENAAPSMMLRMLLKNSEEVCEDGSCWWELDFEYFLPPEEELL